MAITINEGGVLYELDGITANEGGVLYELDSVMANESGVLYEIYGGKLINIYSTQQTSDDAFEAHEYPTGISIYRQANTSTNMSIHIEFNGVKSGDTVRLVMNYRRDAKYYVPLIWEGASDVESDLKYSSNISKGYIDIYGNTVNVAPCYFQFTATQDNPKISFYCNGELDNVKPLTVSIFSLQINGAEMIEIPYTNYFANYPVWALTAGKSKLDASEVVANLTPTEIGWETQLSIDPGGTYGTHYAGTIIANAGMTITGTVTKGSHYRTASYSGPESGSVSMTIGSTTIASGDSGTTMISSGDKLCVSAVSDRAAQVITGSATGTSITSYPYGDKAKYNIQFVM